MPSPPFPLRPTLSRVSVWLKRPIPTMVTSGGLNRSSFLRGFFPFFIIETKWPALLSSRRVSPLFSKVSLMRCNLRTVNSSIRTACEVHGPNGLYGPEHWAHGLLLCGCIRKPSHFEPPNIRIFGLVPSLYRNPFIFGGHKHSAFNNWTVTSSFLCASRSGWQIKKRNKGTRINGNFTFILTYHFWFFVLFVCFLTKSNDTFLVRKQPRSRRLTASKLPRFSQPDSRIRNKSTTNIC